MSDIEQNIAEIIQKMAARRLLAPPVHSLSPTETRGKVILLPLGKKRKEPVCFQDLPKEIRNRSTSWCWQMTMPSKSASSTTPVVASANPLESPASRVAWRWLRLFQRFAPNSGIMFPLQLSLNSFLS
ncbi:hypothetical protein PMIN02_005877 [Paraphaeosphaeria minitans]